MQNVKSTRRTSVTPRPLRSALRSPSVESRRSTKSSQSTTFGRPRKPRGPSPASVGGRSQRGGRRNNRRNQQRSGVRHVSRKQLERARGKFLYATPPQQARKYATMPTPPRTTAVNSQQRNRREDFADAKAQARAAAMQTMDPLTAPAIRLQPPDAVNPKGTALARTISRTPMEWSNVQTSFLPYIAGPNDDNGEPSRVPLLDEERDFPYVLLRDSVVRSIYRVIRTWDDSQDPPPLPFYVIDYNLPPPGKSSTHTTQTDNAIIRLSVALPFNVAATHLRWYSGPDVYGRSVPTGWANGQRVFWVDSTYQAESELIFFLQTTDNAVTCVGEYQIRLIRHDGEGVMQVVRLFDGGFANPGQSQDGSLPFQGSGYYSVQIGTRADQTNDECSLASLQLEIATHTHTFYRHDPTTDLQAHSDSITQMRVLGAAVLLQNQNAEFIKGGNVMAAQFDPGQVWHTALTDRSVLSTISIGNGNSFDDRNFANGFYAYVKPATNDKTNPFLLSQPFTRALHDGQDTPGLGLHEDRLGANFYPFKLDGFVVIRVRTPPPSDNLPVGGMSTNVICATLFEYTTEDQIFEIEYPFMSPVAYQYYAAEMLRAPQFFENPHHLESIKRFLRNVGNNIVKWGPTALTLASFAGRLLSTM